MFKFSSKFTGPNAPLKADYDGVVVAPSDTVDVTLIPNLPCVGVFIGGAGNVAVQLSSGGTATLTGLVAGQIVDVAVKRVLATGTTATGISALYDLAG